MNIRYNDSIYIEINKKEAESLLRWLSVQGLNYNATKDNPVKSVIGEFFIQLADFLSREDGINGYRI